METIGLIVLVVVGTLIYVISKKSKNRDTNSNIRYQISSDI